MDDPGRGRHRAGPLVRRRGAEDVLRLLPGAGAAAADHRPLRRPALAGRRARRAHLRPALHHHAEAAADRRRQAGQLDPADDDLPVGHLRRASPSPTSSAASTSPRSSSSSARRRFSPWGWRWPGCWPARSARPSTGRWCCRCWRCWGCFGCSCRRASLRVLRARLGHALLRCPVLADFRGGAEHCGQLHGAGLLRRGRPRQLP